MALTPTEHAIVSLRDDGLSIDAIATRLGRSHESVSAIAYQYTDGLYEDRRHRRAMERGSRTLLARIRAARGGAR